MIKIKTKAEIRQELEDEIHNFLNSGGEIEDIHQGVSGKDIGANIDSRITFTQEKQPRTPLTTEVQALDARKQKKKPEPAKPSRPKKRIIYDDFGEPLREVWEE